MLSSHLHYDQSMKAETSVGLHMKGWESALWWLWLQFIWISSGGEKKKNAGWGTGAGIHSQGEGKWRIRAAEASLKGSANRWRVLLKTG